MSEVISDGLFSRELFSGIQGQHAVAIHDDKHLRLMYTEKGTNSLFPCVSQPLHVESRKESSDSLRLSMCKERTRRPLDAITGDSATAHSPETSPGRKLGMPPSHNSPLIIALVSTKRRDNPPGYMCEHTV